MTKMISLVIAMLITSSVFATDASMTCPFGFVSQGYGRGPQRMIETSLMGMDFNKDGKVTKKEMKTWFKKLDINKDGVLTKDEIIVNKSINSPPFGRGRGFGRQ